MSDFKKIAQKLGTEGPAKTLPTPRKVSILFGGSYIIRTTNATYVWEHPYYPQYYVPLEELQKTIEKFGGQLSEVETFHDESNKTKLATQYSLTIPSSGKSTSGILAFNSSLPSQSAAALQGMVKIDFASMEQWLEEDTPIHVHPKDPFKRVDVLQSTRSVRVSVEGQEIARTNFSMHLYETGLPCRFYLPLTAFDAKVLKPSEKKTKCPYKGEAEYFSVELESGKVLDDLVWYYRNPTLESAGIVGLLCPYNERVDIELDGVLLEKPDSPFARKIVGGKV